MWSRETSYLSSLATSLIENPEHTLTHLIWKLFQIYRKFLVKRIPYPFYPESPVVNHHICFIISPPPVYYLLLLNHLSVSCIHHDP